MTRLLHDRVFRCTEMFDELGITIVEEKIVMDDRLTWHDAEQVDQALGRATDVSPNDFSARVRVEDGEVDVRVRVRGVEQSAKTDRVRGFPYLKDAVDVNKVVEEAAVFVLALASAD